MSHWKRSHLILIYLVLTIFVSGCALPSSARKTGYLQNYAKLRNGEYLENYWANSNHINKNRYSVIQVEKINVNVILGQKGVTAEDSRKWLWAALIRNTASMKGHFLFAPESNKAQARLEIAITEMTPGSAGGRMLAAEVGLGHAWVQVEGKIVDINSGEELVSFSDRRRSSGAIGLRDIAGDVGPTLVREMLEQIASDIAKELRVTFSF